jgi:hypothetical protein
LWIEPAGVRVHPDGGLYSGDRLSFQITAHNNGSTDLTGVPLIVNWGTGEAKGAIRYIPHGGTGSVDLAWVWDTKSLTGTQTITVTLDPEERADDLDRSDKVATIQIDLAPQPPADEIGAEWQTTTSRCCRFHFISGTAAARDIASIEQIADEAMAYVENQLGVQQTEPLEVSLVNRVLGHGGFAQQGITITYVDRDYAGGGLREVLRHEGTHLLDHRLTHGERPAMLVEGFAVYVAGGHFKPEPLPERAAALLQLGRWIPLRDLANSFYGSQHESGYLEAGAFIAYLVKRSDFQTFVKFYGSLQRRSGETDADMIDREMRAVYGVGLEQMESEWQSYLHTLDAAGQRSDLANTIAFYDTVRRYQQTLDPSAHFLSAWLPDVGRAQSLGVVADYLRHPRQPENIAIETMLVSANAASAKGDFDQAATLLAAINHVLDSSITFSDPIAARYLNVVRATLASSYDPQRIMIDGDRAEVWAKRSGDPLLHLLSAGLQDGAWLVRLSQ